MQARALGDRPALQRALPQVDAAARRIEVVAQKLVGRAGRGAKTAVHALAQDGFGFQSFRRTTDEVGELGLHRDRRYTFPMGKMFTLAALALIVALVAWAWITARKYAARKRLEEERAAAFIAEAASALRKGQKPPGKS